MPQEHKTYKVTVLRDFGNFQSLRTIISVSVGPPKSEDLCLAKNEKVVKIVEQNDTTVIDKRCNDD